jgi:hypothetical protein
VEQNLDKGEEVCVIVLDIMGAFDKVWHNGLGSKLRSKGVSGRLLSWLQNYISDRYFIVVLSGLSSETASINASEQQGSIFSIHYCSPSSLITLLTYVKMSSTCMAADDSTLYAPI